MSKICFISNMASSYREPIFKLLDDNFDINWFFGEPFEGIKEMNLDGLKSVKRLEKLSFRSLYWQKGVQALGKDERYSTYIMLGEPFCVSTWALMLRNRLRRNPKNIVLWSHGWYGREGFLKRIIKKTFFGLADKVMLYGNYAKDVAVEQGFPAEKLTVIHNSLNHKHQLQIRNGLKQSDVYLKHFGNNNPVIIFIGRLTAVKRLDQLIEAVGLLGSRGAVYNLIFVGDGPMKNELEAMAQRLGIKDQTWFYGACYDDTVNAQLIYDADLCVAPGNVGLTAMHSMVFGTPVLTHDNFPMQMPEFEAVKPGETGSFFKYNDINSLADKIHDWIEKHKSNREDVRTECFKEIDIYWTPEYQFEIIKHILEN